MKTIITLGVFVCISVAGLAMAASAQVRETSRSATNCGDTKAKSSVQAKSLEDLDLEQLMNVEVKVTSASKKEERLEQAPAAIFVVTSEDIRRGGFISIPDTLRMVPGLYVARINADWWSVSARGFSDYLNNKMLVLVDGRSVYSPEFGGVEWDQQEIPMEEIERIEVIRGPGGTLWGANATNGVINIITKNAGSTKGFSVATSASPEEGYTTSVTYGGKLARDLSFRAMGKAEYWYPGLTPSGANAFDLWNMSQGGLRLDWKGSANDKLTVDGRGYSGRVHDEEPLFPAPGTPKISFFDTFVVKGGHFLSRWRHTFSERSGTDALGYCDWTQRSGPFQESRNTCDVEFQHDYQFCPRHSVIWGGSILTTASYKPPFFQITLNPAARRDTIVSGFAQYEFDVVPDRLRIIGGSKFDHNPYTGFEIQPQIRGVWTPARSHVIWGAVSRAVRTPSEIERDDMFQLVQLPGSVPTYLTVFGDPNLRSESLRAYEAGYRYQWGSTFSFDADAFYNHYENLINVDLVNIGTHGTPIVHVNPVFVDIPAPWENLGPGQTHGAEVYAKVRAVSRWMLAAGVTEVRGNSMDLNDALNLPITNTPRHQFNLQSRFDITRLLAFDSALYHYGGIPLDPRALFAQNVHAHNRVDIGVSSHSVAGFAFSIWGRDLATDRHPENLPFLFSTSSSYVQRSVVFSLMWRSSPEQQ